MAKVKATPPRKYRQIRGSRIELGGKQYTLAELTDQQIETLGLHTGKSPYFEAFDS